MKIKVGDKVKVVFNGGEVSICTVIGDDGEKNGMKVYDLEDSKGMGRWCYENQITQVLTKH